MAGDSTYPVYLGTRADFYLTIFARTPFPILDPAELDPVFFNTKSLGVRASSEVRGVILRGFYGGTDELLCVFKPSIFAKGFIIKTYFIKK